MMRYTDWLDHTRGLKFTSYEELWHWSVTDLSAFWGSIWDFFDIQATRQYGSVITNRSMPGAEWFSGATLNYAAHALAADPDLPAVISSAESQDPSMITYRELSERVAATAHGLKQLGVRRGDRVVALLPNIPQTLTAFLASASIGAIWSSCSPEFGASSVRDRFQQIEPKVLLAVDGYTYNGRDHDRMPALDDLRNALPTLEHVVVLPQLDYSSATKWEWVVPWDTLCESAATVDFEQVPFDHPLWILYSSGTTGLPKPIVQGHGGILLEHLKALGLHLDIGSPDRFFWFTTTGWMMWNFLSSGLLLGASIVFYDGSPSYPDMRALWRLAEACKVTFFGTSASYIQQCMQHNLRPGEEFDLTPLKSVGSTGSPLSPEGFRWIYDSVKADLLLGSASGGTDVCTPFVGPCPLLPVHAGEIQCRLLGAAVQAFDGRGRPLIDAVGEMVVTEPLPSMPLHLWNDPGDVRLREAYFEMFPGVWRHGDWAEITSRGSCIIHGRSDATLNRGGIRTGTSDYYRVVESMPEVTDSLVVETSRLGNPGQLLLFVVLKGGGTIAVELCDRIKAELRRQLSPRHIPDAIYAVSEIPRTLTGKKLEVPIRRMFTGTAVADAMSLDSLANPQVVEEFVLLRDSVALPA